MFLEVPGPPAAPAHGFASVNATGAILFKIEMN
jgi:hypothetical protein